MMQANGAQQQNKPGKPRKTNNGPLEFVTVVEYCDGRRLAAAKDLRKLKRIIRFRDRWLDAFFRSIHLPLL
jgi:hypothetical protein